MTTTTTDLDKARQRLRGDWDAQGTITVGLPDDVATALLESRGWTREQRGADYVLWVAPDGGWCWERDEALTLALVAEAGQ